MTSLALSTLAHLALLATPAQGETYAAAHQKTEQTGQPMMVMVSAEWCPACQVMERAVLPQLRKRGLLRRVSFAVVNVDQQQELGQQLTGGGPIPQLIMFVRTPLGWKRSQLIGGQQVQRVEEFINEGVAATKAEPEAHQQTSTDSATTRIQQVSRSSE